MNGRRRTRADRGDLGTGSPHGSACDWLRTRHAILYCLDRYLASRQGDVKKLKPPGTGFRLRCGDYRVSFDQERANTIEITGIRREAYR